jgi:CubicO group peptidase (beta-lactamase class C family)
MEILWAQEMGALSEVSMPPATFAMSKTADNTLHFPDAPASIRFSEWLAAFNSSDPELLQRMVTACYTIPSENTSSLEQQIRDLEWHRRWAGRLLVKALQSTANNQLDLIVEFGLTQERWKLVFQVEDEPPHYIRSVEFTRAQPRLNLGNGPTSDSALAAAVLRYVRRLAHADIFSGTILLAHNGEILVRKAYGLANQSYRIKNRIDTRYCIGSMNKMFTGVAIMELAQQGRIDLNDPINHYLLDYNIPSSDKITVHHLLTHTSGLGTIFNETFFASSRERYRNLDSYVPIFVDDPLAFAPGTSWQYSTAGYILLGLIIERVSGLSYDDYVRVHIHEVADMPNTACYEMDTSVPNLAYGYTHFDLNYQVVSLERRSNLFLSLYKGTSTGGGFSTVDDLLHFALALQENRLLDPEHTQRTITTHVETDGTPHTAYGYGFELTQTNRGWIIGHSGGFCGVTANLDIFSESGYVSIVLSNYDFPGPFAIIHALRHLILQSASALD